MGRSACIPNKSASTHAESDVRRVCRSLPGAALAVTRKQKSMVRSNWRLSQHAAAINISPDLDSTVDPSTTHTSPAHQNLLKQSQQAFAGSILVRRSMTAAPHRSGLAIVAPSGAHDRADGLHLMRDDERALPLDTIPLGSPASLSTPDIKLVKWTTITKDWTRTGRCWCP